MGAPVKSKEWYLHNGVTVVNQPDAAPMSFLGTDGQPQGFIIDIWRQWSKVTGVPVTFHFADWTSNINDVKSGKYDIHGGLLFFPNRAKKLDYSRPYHTLQISLVVDKDEDTSVGTIAENYSVGMMDMGTLTPKANKVYSRFNIRKFATLREVAKGLATGEVQAAIGNYPILAYELKRLGSKKQLISKELMKERPFHAAVSLGNITLLAMVNQGLKDIDAQTYDVIRNRWFVPEVKEMAWLPNVLYALGALVVVALLMFVFFSSRSRTDT